MFPVTGSFRRSARLRLQQAASKVVEAVTGNWRGPLPTPRSDGLSTRYTATTNAMRIIKSLYDSHEIMPWQRKLESVFMSVGWHVCHASPAGRMATVPCLSGAESGRAPPLSHVPVLCRGGNGIVAPCSSVARVA